MKKVELLSPAGNMESLKAAVYAGCDAVYIGGKNFGARSYAGNFDIDEIKNATEFCHLYNVKIYVTLNTIIYETEVKAFMKYVDTLVNINVDAFIMQDIGMIDLVRKTYPDFEIHASTQMHIHNKEGVMFAKELGIKRVVLARETEIEDVAKIKEETNMEIEIFAHGALCVSYSGQCLMSYFIGGRSGNRGTCAQCCRQKYSLEIQNDKIITNKYLLSMKDLNTLENIGKIIDSSIDSIKIEGRMKRPEYVFLVTKIYRKAIDNYYKYKDTKITKQDFIELEKIFNRKFTKGFLFHEDNSNIVNTYIPNHMGVKIGKILEIKKDYIICKLDDNLSINDGIRILEDDIGFTVTNMYVKNKPVKEAYKNDIVKIKTNKKDIKGNIIVKTTDNKQLDEIEKEIDKKSRKVNISGKIDIKYDQKICLTLKEKNNIVKVYSDKKIEKSINNATTKEDVLKQINKLGNTVYNLNNLEINLDDNLFVPVSILNNIRREAILKLNEQRLKKINYLKKDYYIDVPDFIQKKNKSLYVHNDKLYEYVKGKKFDNLYIDYDSNIKSDKAIKSLPRVINKFHFKKDYYLLKEVGSIYKYKKGITDTSLNVTNSYSVAYLHSIGIDKVTLSYELNDNLIKKILENYKKRYNKNPNIELVVYGKPEVMITKYNILKKYNQEEGYLIDRFKNKYFIKNKKDYMLIYNYELKKLENISKYYELGINSLRYELLEKDDLKNI